MQKLRSIQVLRAVAAIAVVIVHTSKGATHLGDGGVDLFFVISGFIMAQVSENRTRADFIKARLWRIFPLYFVCAALWWLRYSNDPGVPHNFCRDMTSLTLWPVWDGVRCQPYLRQGWSLSYELLFYGLIALFIRRTNWIYVAIPALVAGYLLFPESPLARFLGWPYLLEFLAGFTIARLPLCHGKYWLTLGAMLFLLAPIEVYSPLRALWWGVPSAMIVYGALGLEQSFKSKAFDVPVWLGDASYSIYLGHTLFMSRSLPVVPLTIMAIACSCLIFVCVERPLNLVVRRVPKNSKSSSTSRPAGAVSMRDAT